MKKDYTFDITGLIEARGRMQAVKKIITSEVRARHEAQIQREIKERQMDAEVSFAHEIALAAARGVPHKAIRQEVLRTNDWERWTYWRDLAGLDPERVSVRNAKEAEAARNRPYQWIEGAIPFAFDVVKDLKGNSITPIRIEVESATSRNYANKEQFWPKDYSRDLDFSGFGGYADFDRAVSAEIKRAFEAGEIPEVIEPYDASQRAKKNTTK